MSQLTISLLLFAAFTNIVFVKSGSAASDDVDIDLSKTNPLPFQPKVYNYISAWASNSCSGSLISRNYILTSAWCADRATQSRVMFGLTYLNDEPKLELWADEIILHENYDGDNIDKSYDIALIKLTEPIELNENVKTVELPKRSDASEDYTGKTVKVGGWGMNGDAFLVVTNEVIKREECTESYDILAVDHFCAKPTSSNAKSVCGGDFGAPLMTDTVQIGIASCPFKKICDLTYPSTFTRVTDYLDWIEEHSDLKINK